MPPIRTLVVDDSPTARALLIGILGMDAGIEVIAEASNGNDALALVRTYRPDVVTMDIEMPGLNGFDATRAIMAEVPTPIVVISGTADSVSVARSMQALEAGALTVLSKPSAPGSPEFASEARRILDAVTAMAAVKVIRRHIPRQQRAETASGRYRRGRSVIGMVASTGGPGALATVLGALPSTFPAPILVVQHMAEGFIAGFVEWLATRCALCVQLARHGVALDPGTIYVAPEHCHLGVSPQKTVMLSNAEPVQGFRPSATFLLASIALVYREYAVAVVLTGMGRDGADGARTIGEQGGLVIAQDEETSVVFGMPAAAVEATSVATLMPVTGISSQLIDLTSSRNGNP